MLFLLFQLGADRYALDASRVVEVLPLVELRKIPNAPRGVAGIFNYRGQPVPVADLSDLILHQPARERLTTRIILIRHADDAGGEHLLGLIAEQVTRVIRRERGEFHETGLRLGQAPYLGPMLLDEHGMVQLVREEKLLPNEVRDALLAEAAAAT